MRIQTGKKNRILVTFASALIILSFGCSSLVNKMTFYPDNEYIPNLELLPKHISQKSITTEDDLKIKALYFSNETKRKNVLIYFHGNAGNFYHRIDTGEKLFSFNTDVLLVSYRGYAKCEGKPSEKGIYLDAEAAVSFAINELGYDINSIIIYGRSIGSTAAVNVSQSKNISKLILITPLSSGDDLAEAHNMNNLKSVAGHPFNNLEKISNIICPLLIIHGNKDEVVP